MITAFEVTLDRFAPDGVMQARVRPEIVKSTKDSHDSEVTATLWEKSEEMTGVKFPLVAVPG